MEHITKMLNYSFSKIDIENYIDSFFANRIIKLNYLNQCNYSAFEKKSCDEFILKLKKERRSNEIKLNPNGIITEDSLIHILITLYNDKKLSELELNIINKLQKKFELFHRIFTAYNKDLFKNSDEYKHIPNYAYLSLVLMKMFTQCENFNYLNTSIKLNDLIVQSEWAKSSDLNLIILTINFEKRCLEDLHNF